MAHCSVKHREMNCTEHLFCVMEEQRSLLLQFFCLRVVSGKLQVLRAVDLRTAQKRSHYCDGDERLTDVLI